MSVKKISRRAFCAAAACAIAPLARAEAFPSRPIRLIVAGSPGASTDTVARALGIGMSERLGVPVIVEDRAGANGIVAGQAVARTAADGYMLLVTPSDSQVLGPLITKELPYSAERDFTPVAKVAELNLMITASTKVAVDSIHDLVALAKARPGQLTYGSSGLGGVQQLTIEMLCQRAGITMLHVPYRGGAEVATAIAAGEIDVFAGSALLLAPLAKAGKVKALAIAKETRSPVLPAMPTMAEAGYPNFVSSSWYGVFGPANMPADVLAKLSDAMIATVNSSEYGQRMALVTIDPSALGHAEFASYVGAEWTRWRALLQSSGITTVR